MKRYFSLFRIRYINDLQYRTAAIAGCVTQAAWGFFFILLYRAFYRENPSNFPMKMSALSSYIWLGQAFLAIFMAWFFDSEILASIQSGSVAVELCRPVSIYGMWFAKTAAVRLSKATLRFAPILIVALLLPYPYGLSAPESPEALFLFILSIALALSVIVAFTIFVYTATFYTVSSMGVRMIAISVTELLSGAVIPLPFFPESAQKVINLLPFAAMQNVPLRIYSGDMAGAEAYSAVALQLIWAAVLITSGSLWLNRSLKKVIIQGG